MKTLALAATFALAGCAAVPADAPVYSRAPAAPEGYATVYIYRVGTVARARRPDVTVDGTMIFEPPMHAYTWAHIKAGQHPFALKWAADIPHWPSVNWDAELIPGESYYFRIEPSAYGVGLVGYQTVGYTFRVVVKPMPRSDAEKELMECCRYIPPEQQRYP